MSRVSLCEHEHVMYLLRYWRFCFSTIDLSLCFSIVLCDKGCLRSFCVVQHLTKGTLSDWMWSESMHIVSELQLSMLKFVACLYEGAMNVKIL